MGAMTPEQTAKLAADTLLGNMKKYAHTIQFKAGNKVTIQSDARMERTFCSSARETLLACEAYPEAFVCRWRDIESYQTEKLTQE